MHIAINARGLETSMGGVKTYLEKIIPALLDQDALNRYTVFHSSSDHRAAFPGAEDVYFTAPHRLLWENAYLPAAIQRAKPDLLFCPKNFVPWFTSRRIKTVAVVHDLLYYQLGEDYLPEYLPEDVAYTRMFLRRSLKRTDRIVAVSDNTRQDLLRLFGLDAKQLSVIHHGVSIPAEDEVSDVACQGVRERYTIRNPFIFYCGSLSPRKNIVRVLEAFAMIADKVPHDFVVTAGKSWKDTPVFEAAERLGLTHRFIQLGHVSTEDMPALYGAADCFVYPSLYEGFGMPILEAMACGCPVLTSNTSSIPEVAGDAAAMVDPLNTQAISELLLRILTDSHFSENLRRRGAERAAMFTWESSARRLIDVFESSNC
jgi:glycosyltransferase involved in cell wall biosynthesis